MSQAIRAKNARERALIAVRIIKTGEGLHEREFDDCFEMGDADEVMEHLICMTREDYILAKAMKLRASDLGDDDTNPRLLRAIEESLNNPIMNIFDERE